MRPVVRISLRRCVHSLPPLAPPPRTWRTSKVAIGTSLAIAGYVSWRIAGNDQRIALDASPQHVHQKTDGASDTSRKTEVSAPSGHQIQVEHESVDRPPQEEGKSAAEEAEEEGEGAFNPATGEINWDCPCLGGMAHGPCGQEFREAFSCFVFSEKEPKGIDCVEKFKCMQDCFRAHPDIYGEEIADDEEDTHELSEAGDKPSHPDSSATRDTTINAIPLSEDASRISSNSTQPVEP